MNTEGNVRPGLARSIRQWPGFTPAAVAFVMVVLLGGGGVAMAQWSQSATATIEITAGAVPTTVPPAGSRNIVANPVIAKRPTPLSADTISCSTTGSSGRVTVIWAGDDAAGISYAVSLKSVTSPTAFQESKSSTQRSVVFTLNQGEASYGEYIFRVQAMKGGVAGDPIYRTLRYFGKDDTSCYYANPAGQSPLANITISTAPVGPAPNDNALQVSWTSAAKDASYVVSVESKDSPYYGVEFTTNTLAAVLTFPPRLRDKWNNPIPGSDFFRQYSLRIIPMNGTQAGDPVYKTVQYGAYDLTVW